MDEFPKELFTTKIGKNIDPESMIVLLEEYRDNIEYDCTADSFAEILDEIIDGIRRGTK